MILGGLTYSEGEVDPIVGALLRMLADDSVFVKSRMLTELAVLGRNYAPTRGRILRRVRPCSRNRSGSVRSKAAKILRILENGAASIPVGWVKAGG
jgi:hypothetical protein